MDPIASYTVSIDYDRRLYRQDIAGSIAHAGMLGAQGIIEPDEAERIIAGLHQIRVEIEDGDFPWRPELEDIHMNVERRLHEIIGDTAGKLHTARSRNDQIALDVRMYTKEVADEAVKGVDGVRSALLGLAEEHSSVVMPGYTHVQRAQPVLFAHHMLAYFEMLTRDRHRFLEARREADAMPLGSGALAGLPYPLDREAVRIELGFSRVTANSMDAVSDRDFLVTFHSAAVLCMIHLSRLAEELVIWSSEEFGFVRLADQYTTGSSIMPQKRNPDFAEIARGKTGRVFGNLVGLLTILKGLPLTYNRDLQEDKEGFFDTVDTLLATLAVFAGMLSTMQVEMNRMRDAAQGGNMLATDVADYLVSKGMPFRRAHGVVAELTAYAEERSKALHQLTLEQYRRFSDSFDEDVLSITVDASIAARDVPGGTSYKRVRRAIEDANAKMASDSANE